MEHPDSHSVMIFSSDLLANLEQLAGQQLCIEEQPTNQQPKWLKKIIGREDVKLALGIPEDLSLYDDIVVYPWRQGLRLCSINSKAIVIEQVPKQSEHIFQDCYLGVLLTQGEYKLEQDGRRVLLKPGDMTICDVTKPYSVTSSGPFSMIVISIPHFLLDERLANIRRLTAIKLSTNSGAGAIAASMILSTVNQLEQLDEAAFQALAEPMLELFALSLREIIEKTKTMSCQKSQTLLRVKQFIAGNFTDPSLKADTIASAMGLSVRYINNLFNEDDTSLMRYLTQQRLARSRHYLASSLYQHLSIAEVAIKSGFSNMAHFSRVFHQTYHMSPRSYRYHCQKDFGI